MLYKGKDAICNTVSAGIIIALILILSLFFSAASADQTGTCGENIMWTLDSEGVLSLTGTGPMPNWDDSQNPVPWKDYQNNITGVVIGEGITSVGSYAFSSMPLLTDVTFPETLTEIGSFAFEGCSIKTIILPENVEAIGESAFISSVFLESVVLPDSLTSIQKKVFSYCQKLSSVTLPANLEVIGTQAFSHCSVLKNITFPVSLKTIRSLAFYDCKALESIDLPAGITSVEPGVFAECSALTSTSVDGSNAYYCSLDGVLFTKDMETLLCYPPCKSGETYKVPDTVKIIEQYAFDYSTIKQVTLPEDLEKIQDLAFCDCYNLESINFPDTLTTLGMMAFGNCTGLHNADIVIPGSVEILPDYLFGSAAIHSVVIQEGVKSIKSNAFFLNNSENTTITLPQSVRVIESGAINSNITIFCYENSPSDTWAKLNGNPITYIGTYDPTQPTGEILDSGEFNNIIWELNDLGTLTFTGAGPLPDWDQSENPVPWKEYQNSVTKVNIGEGITHIGNYAFSSMPLLAEASLPDTLTTIGDYAFQGCSIKSITLPENVESVGLDAFSNSSFLESVILPDKLTRIQKHTFSYCQRLASVVLPSGLEVIERMAFAHCSALQNISFPVSLKTITEYAFYECDALDSIDLPASISSVDPAAFADCKALKSIQINESNSSYCSVDGILFTKNMDSLLCYPAKKAGETYIVPDTVKTIAEHAFSYSFVKHVVLPEALEKIQDLAFCDCYNLESINFPDTLTTLGMMAFGNCTGLHNADIVIPGSVEILPDYLFGGAAIHSVVIQEGVKSIKSNAFFLNNSENTTITLPQSVQIIAADAIKNDIRIFSHHDTYSDNWAQNNGNPVEYICDEVLTIQPAAVSADGYIRKSCSVCGYSEQPDIVLHHDRILNIPASITYIGEEAFSGIKAEQVVLPAGVMSVEGSAFSNNAQLCLALVSEAETQFADTAFSNCPNLRMLCLSGSKAEQFAIEKGIPYVLSDDTP